MHYRKSDNTVEITISELASYARSVEHAGLVSEKYGFSPLYDGNDISAENGTIGSSSADRERQQPDCIGENQFSFSSEADLVWSTQLENLTIAIHGRSNSIAFDGKIHTVEECKTVASFRNNLTPFTDPSLFAQAVCYAFILCETNRLDSAAVKLTFIRRADGARKTFRAVLSYTVLSKIVHGLLHRALPFLQIGVDRATFRLEELTNLPFPYPTIRPGQKDFVAEGFRTIKNGGRLFASAPCGIGKTMSALYPALRAIGMGKCDRIFYCTAKTITGKSALDAAERLAVHAPHMRAILLLAKELMCPSGTIDGESSLALKCPSCSKTHGIGWEKNYQSYEQRQSEAVLEILHSGQIYTPEILKSCAERHQVCPHELALDVSEYCDLIVCDYNYVFDDSVRLRRYFKDVRRQENYVFLIDEAHNLPDRARSMYSAALHWERFRKLRSIKDSLFPGDADFEEALLSVEKWFASIFRLTKKEAHTVMEKGQETTVGYYRDTQIPKNPTKRLENLQNVLRRYIRDKHEFAGELVPYRQEISAFLYAAGYMDEHFCFFASSSHQKEDTVNDEVFPATPNAQLTVQLLCLDPSGILDNMLRSAHASIFFSATLAPAEYYQSVTGSPHSTYLDLPSPYEKENLCLIAYDGISTRFSDRRGTVEETADLIARIAESQEGNYIVYFPSYTYMKSVYKVFRQITPGIRTVVQKSGMSFQDRAAFLSVFESGKYPHLVGFCVLGGMFSEGIDLRGNSLIGAIIVGTGLPGLSAELNLTAEYYQNTTENGREFAYVYPGMNKVLQAAGRVIRSESDRGVVVLIDDRYNEPGMKMLFPSHWQHIKYTADPDSMERILKNFWKNPAHLSSKSGTAL